MSTYLKKTLLLVAIASLAVSSAAQQHTIRQNAACVAVENVDFQNASFESGGTVFSFHHGKAFHRDCETCQEQRVNPDWEATIERDTILRPSLGVTVRFLLLHDDHKTGTGWWYHLVGFQCASPGDKPGAKTLSKVFDRKAMSLSVEQLTDREVMLSLTDRRGKRSHYSYVWDEGKGGYTLKNSLIGAEKQ